uniref:Uncharacterized protein n=1 Tax=Arundo donax TaxID=35708 RepID=A0A0A9FNE5_ARUDO
MKETAQLESTITACLAPNNSTASTAHGREKLCEWRI